MMSRPVSCGAWDRTSLMVYKSACPVFARSTLARIPVGVLGSGKRAGVVVPAVDEGAGRAGQPAD
jgi:hypothetical protein